jgi:hypothetical protein
MSIMSGVVARSLTVRKTREMDEKKPYIYTPLAPYSKLKKAEEAINAAGTIDQLREAMLRHGPQIGYKAFSYMFTGKLTPEGMKPDEAAMEAVKLELQGDLNKADQIYRRILEVHPQHSIALAKTQDPSDRLVSEIFQSVDRLPKSSNK